MTINLNIEINCENEDWHEALPNADDLLNLSCDNAIEASGFADVAKNIEISVLLTRDEEMRVINNQHRNIDKATNVLSFPNEEFEAGKYTKQDEFMTLGDLAFALETIQKEADEQGKNLQDHFCHLAVHGTLHLLGYDHIEDDEAEEMEALEVKILGAMGIVDPY